MVYLYIIISKTTFFHVLTSQSQNVLIRNGSIKVVLQLCYQCFFISSISICHPLLVPIFWVDIPHHFVVCQTAL